jgi:NAD(P)H dehydrogenase (quinone)
VRKADVLVLQFPLWWGGTPAILKVVRAGPRLRLRLWDGRRFETASSRAARFSVTTGGTPERFSSTGVYGEIERVLIRSKGSCCSTWASTWNRPSRLRGAAVGDAERQAYLAAWEARVLKSMSKPVTRADEDLATSLAAIGPAWQRPAKGP